MPFTIGERDYINTTAKQNLNTTGFDKAALPFAQRATDLFNNTWSGFNHNNFFTSAYGLTQQERFEVEEGYNPFEDQSLNAFGFNMQPFMYSQSKKESKSIVDQILYRSKFEQSPAYVMGAMLGYLFDPSTLLLGHGKIAQMAMKGNLLRKTAKFTGVNILEEMTKQQRDPLRTDMEAYISIGASAIIPSIIQGIKYLGNYKGSRRNLNTIDDYLQIKDYSETVIKSKNTRIKGEVIEAEFKEVDEVLQIEQSLANFKGQKIIKQNEKEFVKQLNEEANNWLKNDPQSKNFINKLIKKEDQNKPIAQIIKEEQAAKKLKDKKLKLDKNKFKKPYILSNDNEVEELFKKAGIKNFLSKENFKSITAKEPVNKYTEEAWNKARSWLQNNGYDGIIINKLNKDVLIKNVDELKIGRWGDERLRNKFGFDETFETIILNDLKKFAPEVLEAESTVGAKNISKKVKQKELIEGEQIQPTGLGIFGEKSQFTPVFDILNNSLILADRIAISNLVDIPIAQNKNTKEFGYQASNQTVEGQSKLFIDSTRLKHIRTIEDLFMQYQLRVADKDIKFRPELFFAGNKKLGHLSLDEFKHAITMQLYYDRIGHTYTPVIGGKVINAPEIQAGARATREFVLSPVGKMADAERMWQIIPEQELIFWKGILKHSFKHEDSVIFRSKIKEGETRVVTKEEVIEKIASRERRLKHLEEFGGLAENYIPNYWNIPKIEKDIGAFKQAVMQSIIDPKQKLDVNKWVSDLLEQKPYIKSHTAQGSDADMFIFGSPRYSRNVRNRTLKLKFEKLAELGYLELDIFGIVDVYMRHMVPDIFMTRKFGDPNMMGFRTPRGTNTESFLKSDDTFYEKGLIQIRDEYAQLQIKKTRNAKKIGDRLIRKLEAQRDLVKGFYGVSENPYGVKSTAIKSAKVINNIVNLTGLAQIADIGRTVMMNGMTRTLGNLMDGWSEGLGKWHTRGLKESQTVGEALDMYFSNRAAQLGNTQDLFSNFSARPDAVLGKVENFTFKYVNMMSLWNQHMKGWYGDIALSRMSEVSLKWALQEGRIDLGARKLPEFFTSKATEVEIKNLATLNINLDSAVKIAKQILAHGEFKNYTIITHKDLWHDAIALDSINYGLKKDINIGIVTPGKGDTPLWMSTETGSLISQYKKFTMAATQRVLMKGLQDKDSKFLIGIIMMTSMGMLIDKIRTEQYGQDYSKKSLTAKITDGIDRSGITGIFFDLNNSIERMFNNRIGLRPILGDGKPYGSDIAEKLGVIGGPNVGIVDKIFNIMYDSGTGGYDHHTARNVRSIMPFQNVWYLDWLFDQVEQGMK